MRGQKKFIFFEIKIVREFLNRFIGVNSQVSGLGANSSRAVKQKNSKIASRSSIWKILTTSSGANAAEDEFKDVKGFQPF